MIKDVNRQTTGQRSGRGLGLTCGGSSSSLLQLASNGALVHCSLCLCVCLQAVSNEAPTSLHLSDYSRGAWLSCALCMRAPSLGGSLHRCWCIPTKGHPPTRCCLNDSPAHVMVEAAEQIVKCIISGGWKVFRGILASVPVQLFITAVQSCMNKKEEDQGVVSRSVISDRR